MTAYGRFNRGLYHVPKLGVQAINLGGVPLFFFAYKFDVDFRIKRRYGARCSLLAPNVFFEFLKSGLRNVLICLMMTVAKSAGL